MKQLIVLSEIDILRLQRGFTVSLFDHSRPGCVITIMSEERYAEYIDNVDKGEAYEKN